MSNLTKLTKLDQVKLNDRRIMAMYYAYGVIDTADDAFINGLDAIAFANADVDQYRDHLTGAVGFAHSIQTSWRVWVDQQGRKAAAR